MDRKKYSYQDDWDAIYSNTEKLKPWIGAGIAGYLQKLFGHESFIESHRDDYILDVGCGDGSFCRYLSSIGYKHIKGIDTSSIIINRCKENSQEHRETVSFERKDIIVDDFTSETYDTVVCWLVLHHIRRQDLDAFIHNLSLLCKRNANVFISFLTTEQDIDERDSLFSEEHNVIYYRLNDIISHFSQFFDVQDVGQEELTGAGTNIVFPYHILKMRKRRLNRDDWVQDLREFKHRTALPDRVFITEAYSTLMELLRDFAYYSNKNHLLDIDTFDILFQKLFRNVSRYICKRLLLGVNDDDKAKYVVILKLNDHSSGVVFTATQYAKDEQGYRPHCRYKDKESRTVSSRAYDLFLAYNHFLRPNPERKHCPELFTLQDHFIQDPQLTSFSFSWDSDKKTLVVSPKKEQKYIDQKKDYSAFLNSMFRKPAGDNEFENYLKENYNSLYAPSQDYPKEFYCFNLGVPGYESWGSLMIEALDSYKFDIKNKLLQTRNGEEIETKLLLEIKSLVFILKNIEYNYYDTFNTHEIRTQAVKAAIAQAMARNMSHNFGSHVLSNLIKENVYQELNDEQVNKLQSFQPVMAIREKGKDVQLSYFLRYLKSRMDYLSEVTFGTNSLLSTRTIYYDVVKEFDRVRILLNYISGIEGFNYRFELLFEDEPMKEHDIAAAFPGDVLGCQAFYNIIENIIRNTAKHAHHEGTVCITIRFKEIKEGNGIEGADELYCVEIDNGVSEPLIDNVVKDQNSRLNLSVLDANNNLRDHSLGLLEMKASAAFLRQLDLQEIESDNYKVDDNEDYYHERGGKKRLNIIKAFKAPTSNGWALGYRFFIQRPKEFLFVGRWKTKRSPEQLHTLGIQLISTEKLKESAEAGEVFPHSFILYEETDPNAINIIKSNKYSTLLPLRQIPVSSTLKESFLSILDSDDDNVYDIKNGILAQIKEKALGLVITGARIKNIVAFMNHGTLDDWKNNRKLKLVENILSNTSSKLPLFSVYSSEPDEEYDTEWGVYINHIPPRIHKELIEAYANKIIIIDERVQKYAEENKEKSIPCWALFASTNVLLPRRPGIDNGVICPPKDIDENDIPLDRGDVIPLAPDKFDDYKEKLLAYIDNNVDNAFLLIHYGILERLFEGNTEEITKYLNKWATGTEDPKEDESILSLGNHAKRVVVTSGRGAHSLDLPESVCFVNLSSVLYACTENRNKYLINYLMYQSRRKKYD